MEIDILLDNFNKIYHVGDTITGNILITRAERFTEFHVMNMTLTGSYTMKNNKVSPPAMNMVKFYNKKIKIAENGKITLGNNNSFQFKFPLLKENSKDLQFFESYHGVLISVSYELVAEICTSKGNLTSESKKINIFVPGQGVIDDMKKRTIPYDFEISPQNLEKIKISQEKIPKFKVTCHVDNTNCDLNAPFNGYVVLNESEIPVKSIELQFVRNENIYLSGSDKLKEISEIQNLQIGDGDVNRDVEIPLFMIFPRFFTCAALDTGEARITFEMNLIIVLINGLVITENFPINTWRS